MASRRNGIRSRRSPRPGCPRRFVPRRTAAWPAASGRSHRRRWACRFVRRPGQGCGCRRLERGCGIHPAARIGHAAELLLGLAVNCESDDMQGECDAAVLAASGPWYGDRGCRSPCRQSAPRMLPEASKMYVRRSAEADTCIPRNRTVETRHPNIQSAVRPKFGGIFVVFRISTSPKMQKTMQHYFEIVALLSKASYGRAPVLVIHSAISNDAMNTISPGREVRIFRGAQSSSETRSRGGMS